MCHGDPCAPNTLPHEKRSWSAHMDLAPLGVADRRADLAVATWSADLDYRPGWADALLDAYGIGPDRNGSTSTDARGTPPETACSQGTPRPNHNSSRREAHRPVGTPDKEYAS
ncbi:phosphotransferase [Streptomyces sp. NPDC020845]|uniref:phosphotransferase n=1 Tax=Streptomyces sp. NPDC020845 TaxID=3365096 RepID=UPI0037983459